MALVHFAVPRRSLAREGIVEMRVVEDTHLVVSLPNARSQGDVLLHPSTFFPGSSRNP